MKNISIFFSALVALLFSVAETSAQITPPYYNPANVNITGGAINGTTVGETTPANATASRLRIGASNDLYLTRYAAKQLMISGDGVGAATNAGWIVGYSGFSGYGALWSSSVAPSNINYALLSNGSDTIFNGTGSVTFRVADSTRLYLTTSLTTSANPLSVTDTTDSSSTTTGALRTAGGLGVAKKSYFGDIFRVSQADSVFSGISGTTKGVRFSTTAAAAFVQGVDNTLTATFQPLNVGGSVVNLDTDGTTRATVSSTGLAVSSGTIQVGSGSTTSAGLIAGYSGSSGYGAIWGTDVTPSSSNYSFITGSGVTYLRGVSETRIYTGSTLNVATTTTSTSILSDVKFDKTITTPGTTGAVTINKTTGRVNFAAAATSLVVTNSLATANSICHVTKATNDATMRLGACVAAAGSITIYADVAPAAETAVNFTVTN